MEPMELRAIIDSAIQSHLETINKDLALAKQTIERHEQTISVIPQMSQDIALMKNDIKLIRTDIDKIMAILEKNAQKPLQRVEMFITGLIMAAAGAAFMYFTKK